MSRCTLDNQHGLSLIELIVTTAVTGVLIVIVMSFLSNQMVENAIQNARAILLLESQTALDVVNSDIKHAARVDDINRWSDPHAPGAPGDPYSWDPGPEVLILATPAKDESNNFLYDDPFAYITHKNNLVYFVEDGTLYRRTLAGDIEGNALATTCPQETPDCPSDTELINNVTDLEVNYFNADDEEVEPDEARSVRVSIVVTDTVYGRDVTEKYSIRSVFRNE